MSYSTAFRREIIAAFPVEMLGAQDKPGRSCDTSTRKGIKASGRAAVEVCSSLHLLHSLFSFVRVYRRSALDEVFARHNPDACVAHSQSCLGAQFESWRPQGSVDGCLYGRQLRCSIHRARHPAISPVFGACCAHNARCGIACSPRQRASKQHCRSPVVCPSTYERKGYNCH